LNKNTTKNQKTVIKAKNIYDPKFTIFRIAIPRKGMKRKIKLSVKSCRDPFSYKMLNIEELKKNFTWGTTAGPVPSKIT